MQRCRARSTGWAVIAAGKHLFPFRTEKLSPLAPMVLGEQAPGRVGRRPFCSRRAPVRGSSSFRPVTRRAAGRATPDRAPAGGARARRATDASRRALRDPRRRTGSWCRAARVAGLASNATSPIASSRRRSASASPCGESQSSAASRSASNSRFGESSRWMSAAATGPSTKRNARCRNPPQAGRLDERGREHRPRPTAPGRRGAAGARARARRSPRARPARRRPAARRETASAGAAARAAAGREGPRIAVREEIEPRLHHAGPGRQPLDRRMERRRLALDAARVRRPSPSRSGRVRVRTRPPGARSSRRTGSRAGSRRAASRAGQDAVGTAKTSQAFARFRQRRAAGAFTPRRRRRPRRPRGPRGGQSGSGASQRLEQWSEAMFWSGMRMWPFSSMCATSST